MTTYHFAFGITNPNIGDTIQWDGTRWIAVPAVGASQTWGQTLALGLVSGGNDPTISNSDVLRFLGPTEGLIAAQESTGITDGQDLAIQAGSNTDIAGSGAGGTLSLLAGGTTGDGEGGSILIASGDSGGSDDAGDVNIQGGTATGTALGGDINLTSGISATSSSGSISITTGDSPDVSGDLTIKVGNVSTAETEAGLLSILGGNGGGGESGEGGNIVVQPGVGGALNTAGQTQMNHGGGQVAIRISQEAAAAHLGNQAINIVDAGLAFFNGTAAERPSVTGSRATGAALVSLLTVLNNMGLITDNTVA